MALMCHIHFVDKLRHPVQFCLTCDIVCHVRVDGCGNQKRLPFKVLSYIIFNYSRIRMDRFHKSLKTPEVAGCSCRQPPSLHQDTTDSWLLLDAMVSFSVAFCFSYQPPVYRSPPAELHRPEIAL